MQADAEPKMGGAGVRRRAREGGARQEQWRRRVVCGSSSSYMQRGVADDSEKRYVLVLSLRQAR